MHFGRIKKVAREHYPKYNPLCNPMDRVPDSIFVGHAIATVTFTNFCRETLVKLSYRKYDPCCFTTAYTQKAFEGLEAVERLDRTRSSIISKIKPVETVEKVPFQKLIFEKWDRNIEKRLVFYVSNNILAIFEPLVGFFVKIFQTKGYSTVSLGGKSQYKGSLNDLFKIVAICH